MAMRGETQVRIVNDVHRPALGLWLLVLFGAEGCRPTAPKMTKSNADLPSPLPTKLKWEAYGVGVYNDERLGYRSSKRPDRLELEAELTPPSHCLRSAFPP